MPSKRLLTLLPALALAAAVHAPVAVASSNQVSIFQDDAGLLGPSAASTLATIKGLGASEVRVSLPWANIATASRQPGSPSSAGSYPAANWAPYDAIDRLAAANGVKLEFDVGYPIPKWAQGKGRAQGVGSGVPWKPNAADFGSFVKAVGTRYSGSFDGLPAVHLWSIWNEPNYGISLAPESTDGGRIVVAAGLYRQLIDKAYSGFKGSGHGGDTILFGELAPHGYPNPGTENVGAPLTFLRALYCVGSNGKAVTGSVARGEGCPSRLGHSFRSKNPLLFNAKGFAAHLYAQGIPPDQTLQPRRPCAEIDKKNSADLGAVGTLISLLKKVSHRTIPIWNTEYGFQTNPPETPACNVRPVDQATQAEYINWAEYISWKNPDVASYDQYLLTDPPAGNFASGLEFSAGSPKASFQAYQVPLFMPVTSAGSATSLEVWGAARPSRFGGPSTALVQFTPAGGGATTTTAVGLKNGYFDTHITFSRSGTVRVAWEAAPGVVEYSRSQSVTIG
jgi:hypothetical protein